MTTITLQIGNSDDKLTQARWHDYVAAVQELVEQHPGTQVHFCGAPPNWMPWQNVAWVFVAPAEVLSEIRSALVSIRVRFGQDAVAWTEGQTTFI